MENAMVEEDSRVETTCASAVKMIPTVAGLQAKTIENVTANASQSRLLVSVPAPPDTTSATLPLTTKAKMAPPSPSTEIFVHQQATFLNTTNTAGPVTSACPPDKSVRLTKTAHVQPLPPPPQPPLCLGWSHHPLGGGDFSNNFSLFKM